MIGIFSHCKTQVLKIFILFSLITAISCGRQKKEETETTEEMKTIGTIERIDPALNDIISNDAAVEILSEGYEWSEGPLWVEDFKMLLFSDVPQNIVYAWHEEHGVSTYLTPSGYTGTTPSLSKEPGSNGLTLSPLKKLVLCQHGDRRIAMMNSSLDDPSPNFATIADNYQGKKLNSPNDLVYKSDGTLFFTDPPYGLPNQTEDSTKELPFQGVYSVTQDQKITLLVDSLTRPNGLAFTPDEKMLIVANSDPEKAVWYAFDVTEDGSLTNSRIFHDATPQAVNEKGLPDGLKIDKNGNIFASGPGGIWIFNKEARLLGKIKLPEATSNCELADDDKTLFITCDMYLLRIKLR